MKNYLPKVGDLIIDCDQIHVVSKVENDHVFYCPKKNDSGRGACTDSIPLNNFDKACLRPLMTASEVKNFLKQLPKEEPLSIPETVNKNNLSNTLKEVLYLNDPIKTARLLIYLIQNTSVEKSLSRFDQSIHDQALTHLAEEISTVSNTTLDVAKKQILSAIKK